MPRSVMAVIMSALTREDRRRLGNQIQLLGWRTGAGKDHDKDLRFHANGKRVTNGGYPRRDSEQSWRGRNYDFEVVISLTEDYSTLLKEVFDLTDWQIVEEKRFFHAIRRHACHHRRVREADFGRDALGAPASSCVNDTLLEDFNKGHPNSNLTCTRKSL